MNISALRNRKVLTLDEVRRRAPSVFATQPQAGVSNDYRFISTVEMVETLLNDGWQIVGAQEKRTSTIDRQGFQQHMLRLRSPSLPMIGDSEIDLLAYNSHDRSTAFRFLAGVYRLACSNGLVVFKELFPGISVRHVGYKAENVLEASYRVIDSIPKISANINDMRKIELAETEKVAFAKAAIVAKYGTPEEGKKQPIAPEQLLRPHRDVDRAPDLWTTFNVIQENIIRGGQRSINGGNRTRAVEGIESNTKINQALWMLADEMRKLKKAA